MVVRAQRARPWTDFGDPRGKRSGPEARPRPDLKKFLAEGRQGRYSRKTRFYQGSVVAELLLGRWGKWPKAISPARTAPVGAFTCREMLEKSNEGRAAAFGSRSKNAKITATDLADLGLKRSGTRKQYPAWFKEPRMRNYFCSTTHRLGATAD